MKKQYEVPEIEEINFNAVDIIMDDYEHDPSQPIGGGSAGVM